MCFFKLFAKKKKTVDAVNAEAIPEESPVIKEQEPVFDEQLLQTPETVSIEDVETENTVVTEEALSEFTVTDDGETESVKVYDADKRRYIIIKYNKSFTARLIQSQDEEKNYYSEIKNELFSYKGVKCRMSWKRETFRLGKKALVKLQFRGKTLAVYLALSAEKFTDTKYKVEDVSDKLVYEDTPCLYRIKNERRLRYVKELIAKIMSENGVEKAETETIDYAKKFPYETTEALLVKNLIKELTTEDAQSGSEFMPSELKKQVSAGEVKLLMRDEVAATLVEVSETFSDFSVKGIINIDTLSENFKDGETVTLEEIKNRVDGFNKKVTYIKVLARGTLDKKLFVEADNFSLDAVKMLTLTGGKALKKSGKK